MDVFVYGTLTDPRRVAEVVDSYVFVGGAVLSGLHVAEGRYPTLVPGGEAGGRLLRTEEVDALDAYEGVDAGLYVRASIPREDGGTVDVYVGDPARLGIEAAWPGEGTFPDRVRAYLDSHDVSVRTVE